MDIDPKKTEAIVIGIEKYDVGQNSDLDGPAHDACEFATWLHSKQVPLEKINLFISPLNSDKLALPNGLSYQAATMQNITQFIENTLSESSAELLFFYWGGHGVITTEGERRLFYTNATIANKKNLDLNALLTFLRTDYFDAKALSRQIVIVDTCANYVENMEMVKKLPKNSFPEGKPLENRQQYVLMAAKPGEFAKNLNAEQTGLFTKELMKLLADQPENQWPPKMKTIRAQLSQRFITLRKAGQTEQTPTYYYYRDWDASEGVLRQISKLKPIFKNFLGVATIILLVGLFIYHLSKDSSIPETNKKTILSDKELRALGASHALQIKATLLDDTERYGSATVWKETEEHLIIVTAYHILQGVKKFEIAAPHLKNGENFATIPSSELEVYAEPTYDLVFIRLHRTNEINQTYPWLTEMKPVEYKKCNLSYTTGRVFGFGKSDFDNTDGKPATFKENIGEKKHPEFCSPSIIKLWLFHSDTEEGMGGAPIFDSTGCFRGVLMGVHKTGQRIAMKSHLNKTYLGARFENFNKPFTEKPCLKY